MIYRGLYRGNIDDFKYFNSNTMQCFYTKWWPYNVFIKDRDNDFWYNIIFEYMWDNQRRKLWMDCPFFQFEIQETNCMQQVVDDNNIKRMRLIYEKFCNFESLNSNEDDYIQYCLRIQNCKILNP